MNKATDIGNRWWFIGLSLLLALIAIIVFVTGKNLPDFLNPPPSDQVVVADQVRRCMQQHALPEAHAVLRSDDSMVFAECNWPPQSYSEVDGYSEIGVTTVAGPGLSEAEGSTDVDRIVAPCSQVKLSYSFGSQGTFEHLPPFVVEAGSIVTPEGNPWPGEARTLNFYFERGEIDVVRNLSYILDQAECMP
jgi:hypothetical protein